MRFRGKRTLHALMVRHFPTKDEGYIWLKRTTGENHVSELSQHQVLWAIAKIPKSAYIRSDVWDRLEELKCQRS